MAVHRGPVLCAGPGTAMGSTTPYDGMCEILASRPSCLSPSSLDFITIVVASSSLANLPLRQQGCRYCRHGTTN